MTDTSQRNSPESQGPPPAPRRMAVERPGYWYFEPTARRGAGAAPVLIGLHGYGQTGADFLAVTRRMAGEGMAACAPQGSNQLWDRQTRTISFSWLTSFERDDSVHANNAFLDRVIDELAAAGEIDCGGVYLMGFSQGSSVAYRYARSRPDRVRGVISICADLPPDVESGLGPLRGIPVFIAYGLRDPIFPQDKPVHAADALRSAGVDVELVSFDRGHIIPSSLGPRIQEWIARHEAARETRERLAKSAARLGA